MSETSFRQSLRVAGRRYRYLGLKAALSTLLTEAVPPVTLRFQQLVGHPTMYELQRSGRLSNEARDAVRAALGLEDRDWDRIEEEFAAVESKCRKRAQEVVLAYPDSFAIERETSLLIYGLTRLLNPRCIVETGVADGTSTYVFLAALERNGVGELHSLDIANDVGALVDVRGRWNLHVCDPNSVEDALAALIRGIPPIDLFFHDADHRFLPQLCEYETFAASAARGSLLVSDDVDMSYAFDTFCRRRNLQPTYIFDARKVVGLVRL